MTYDEVALDLDKFIAYLRANGKRPIAVLMSVVDDHDNTEIITTTGLHDMIEDMILHYHAERAGYRLKMK